MNTALASGAFLIALLSAGLMGYAIQRGATCTVAAIGEIVENGTTKRLIALGETALWVGGGILLARATGLLPMLPKGFALSQWTALGGVLLGLGAYFNGACLFGAIARLGAGDWAYTLSPVGFYFGLTTFPIVFGVSTAHSSPTSSPNFMATVTVALMIAFVGYALWRLWRVFGRSLSEIETRRIQRVWMPHEATILIGITFVVLLVTFGFWTYTDLLVDLSQHRVRDIGLRSLLFVALFAGAILGGLTAGRFRLRPFRVTQLARCFVGGMLMGWGGALTPGGNDWLILVGMPLLWPYAWVSVLTMCGTIWMALTLERRVTSQR